MRKMVDNFKTDFTKTGSSSKWLQAGQPRGYFSWSSSVLPNIYMQYLNIDHHKPVRFEVDYEECPGMLRLVALVRTNVPEAHITSTIRVERIGELGPTLAVTSN
jgi:hypothetical protein